MYTQNVHSKPMRKYYLACVVCGADVWRGVGVYCSGVCKYKANKDE